MAGTETRIKLTAKSIEKLAREQPSGDVWDTELGGFHVRYGKRGLTFRLYYRTKTGKRRMMTLGTYGALTLAQARRDAAEALGIVAQGGDPRAAIEAAKVESQRQQQQTLRAYLNGPYTAYQKRRKDGAGTLRRIEKDFSSSLSDLRLMDELRRGFFPPPCVGVGAVVWLLTCPSASARRF